MNIPEERTLYDVAWSSKLDEIRERRTNDMVPFEAHDAGLRAVAGWARKEALREAVEAIESTTLTLDDIGYENETLADAIRALAEGEQS